MPWVSVIIPCYNVEENLLKRCVKSVLNQKVCDFEILLIDDGSKELYKKFYKSISLQDKRIKIISQQNKGVSAARNNGLRNAKGEYILFLDADDEFTDLFFEEAYAVCKNRNIEMLIGGTSLMSCMRYKEQNKNENFELVVLSGQKKNEFKEHLVGDVLHFGNREGYFGRGSWAKIVKREVAEKVTFNEALKMGEDIIWNIQVLDCCKEVVLAKRIWHLYYVNNESVTHVYNEDMLNMIEMEIKNLSDVINLDNTYELIGYCCHLVDELRKLYDCYLGNKSCTLTFVEKRAIIKRLYTSMPWIMINNKLFRENANKRYKIKSYLYHFKIFFGVLKLRNILRCIVQ